MEKGVKQIVKHLQQYLLIIFINNKNTKKNNKK